jgi:drug/metabolite transporter (DMT)-like permease
VDRRRAVGLALVIVSAFGFGSGGLFAQPVYAAGVGWHVLSAWRFGLAAAVAWLWVATSPRRRRGLRRLDRRTVAIGAALGVLYTGNSGTYYAGLESVSVSLASLIVYVYPAIVAVLSLRFGRRLEGRRPWFALGLAIAGVVLAVGGIPEGEVPPAGGLALVVVSPIIYSVWIVLSARLSGERRETVGGEADDGADAAAATALMMTGTAATYWLSAIVVGAPVWPGEVPSAAWPGLFGVSVVATFIAIQGFYAGTRRIGAAQAALVSTVEPIWTITLAAILFGQVLGPLQLLGGALIIVGVIVAQTPTGWTPGFLRPGLRIADE